MKIISLLLILLAITAITSAFDPSQFVGEVDDKFKALRDFDISKVFKSAIEGVRNSAPSIAIEMNENFRKVREMAAETASLRTASNCTVAALNLIAFFQNVTCTTAASLSLTGNQASIVSYCASCYAQLESALSDYATLQCPRPANGVYLKTAIFYNSYICAQAGGQYCAAQIASFASTIPTNYTGITQAQLNSFCTPCVYLAVSRLVNTNGAVSSIDALATTYRIFGALCSQINGQYCILNYQNLNSLLSSEAQISSGSTSALNNLLNVVCAPCTRILFVRLSAYASSNIGVIAAVSFADIFASFCLKTGGEYCLTKIYSVAYAYIEGGSSASACATLGTGTCTSQCSSLIQNIVNKGGCCFNLILNTIPNVTVQQQVLAEYKTCGVNIPANCNNYAKGLIKFTYTNINTTWFNLYKSTFLAAFEADIALATGGVFIASYSASVSSKRSNCVTACASASDSSSAGNLINNNLVVSDNVNALACEAYYDPSQQSTVTRSLSGYTVVSSASFTSFSFAILLLILCLLF